MVSGVAGGRADYFKVHPTVVRVLLFLLLLATTGPFGIVVDVILAAIIPEAPVTEQTPPLDA
jgi:phage shock protein PspC (stress-responsive transcriptional regulator)